MALLDRGADAVAVGRAAIAHQDWALRALDDSAPDPAPPPLSTSHLRAQGLSDGFAEYMKRWKGFVA
jgi:hypothetical protein